MSTGRGRGVMTNCHYSRNILGLKRLEAAFLLTATRPRSWAAT